MKETIEVWMLKKEDEIIMKAYILKGKKDRPIKVAVESYYNGDLIYAVAFATKKDLRNSVEIVEDDEIVEINIP